jgi:GNAT superfamily N-acetyltransferase
LIGRLLLSLLAAWVVPSISVCRAASACEHLLGRAAARGCTPPGAQANPTPTPALAAAAAGRGKGIGGRLVLHLCGRASGPVWLHTIASTTRFYEKLGFEQLPLFDAPR